MIDTRPLELVSSVMMTGVALFLTVGWTFGFGLMGLLAATDSLVLGGMTCCMAAPAPFAGIALQVLMRWSRRGSAHHYLTEVTDDLGNGTVEAGTLLLPLMQPRLSATVDGREVKLALRRTAGFLTATRPDGGGILPWTLTLRIPSRGKVPHKVGFTSPIAATVGFGLLGLSGPVKADGVTVFAGNDSSLAEAEPVLEAARALDPQKMTLVMVGPDGLTMTDRTAGVTPADLADRLRKLVALVDAVEAHAAG